MKATSILTGDIVGSRKTSPKEWMKNLKSKLSEFGKSPFKWEIFRGDAFQLETKPEEAIKTALLIKAKMKQTKNLDVRIAIGIGSNEYRSNKITRSNGQAFVNSGICFEKLSKRTLGIKTNWDEFDNQWNLYLNLLTLTVDNWTPTTARIVEEMLKKPDINQKALAKKLKKSQSTISAGLKRAGYDEISELLAFYQVEIGKRMNQ